MNTSIRVTLTDTEAKILYQLSSFECRRAQDQVHWIVRTVFLQPAFMADMLAQCDEQQRVRLSALFTQLRDEAEGKRA